MPEQIPIVSAPGAGQGFSSLRITSDYRLDAAPFAGSRRVLINELILFYASKKRRYR